MRRGYSRAPSQPLAESRARPLFNRLPSAAEVVLWSLSVGHMQIFESKQMKYKSARYNNANSRWLAPLALLATITACGGGSSGTGTDAPLAPTALAVTYGVKGYDFSWNPSVGATRYEVAEDPDGSGPLAASLIGRDITATKYLHSLAPQLLYLRLNASYRVRACNDFGCSGYGEPLVPDLTRAIGYFKASSTSRFDQFGASLSLSADGTTLAVGAPRQEAASRVERPVPDQSGNYSGVVYVFVRSQGQWVQQSLLRPGTKDDFDFFGASVSLSDDGNTLAASAPLTAFSGPSVFVYTRSGVTWSQPVRISRVADAAGSRAFGQTVSLSGDASTLAVGVPLDSSVTGAGFPVAVPLPGSVFVYARSGAAWNLQDRLQAANPGEGDLFGQSLALSTDGGTLAIGAPGESSKATGVAGDASDNSAIRSGAAYVYVRGATQWGEQAYIKASDSQAENSFGASVALSGNGNTLAVGAHGDLSASRPGLNPGAAYVLRRSGVTWSEQAILKASNPQSQAFFGISVALADDGGTLAVGAGKERSKATGIDGDQGDGSLQDAGAAYLYTLNGANWVQRAYLKAANTEALDNFGAHLALSGDGTTLAVGAVGESSNATGINGDGRDNSAARAGAVFLY